MKSMSDKQRAKLAAEGTLHPSSTVRRGGRISRKTKPKPKRRKASEMTRIYGPLEFRDWLHRQPCAVCGFAGLVDQAHAKGDGVGRKASWQLSFAACRPHTVEGRQEIVRGILKIFFGTVEGCHREMHRIGVASFEVKHGVTLLELAARTQAQWVASGRDDGRGSGG